MGRKRRLTPREKAEKKRRRLEFMTIFINGKQKRVRRPPTVDGMDPDEFIARNADPIWLMQEGMYEELHRRDQEEAARESAHREEDSGGPDAQAQRITQGGPADRSSAAGEEKRMAIKYSDVEEAFEFVSSAGPGEHCACVHRKTGKTFWSSELAGESDMPEDAGSDAYVEIPHKNDLDLGSRLVGDFVGRHAPQLAGEVDRIFSRRGAYSRCKDLLDRHGLLQKWYDFENGATKAAILEWCRENGLEVNEEESGDPKR